MLDYCQNHRTSSSADVQRHLSERFNFSVSISQLNRVRAAHGLSRQTPLREKKPKTGLTIASEYHEQAGGLLLLAAATETGLLTQLEQDLPSSPDPTCLPLAGSAAVRRRLLLTVLFLGAVGIPRTWDLRGYTASGLALLTGRKRAYGYRYTEAFFLARSFSSRRFMMGCQEVSCLWRSCAASLKKAELYFSRNGRYLKVIIEISS